MTAAGLHKETINSNDMSTFMDGVRSLEDPSADKIIMTVLP
jgi:hypothetical protein